MIYLTINTTEHYISLLDRENPARCYNVPKIKRMTEVGIFRLFMDLLDKIWMNPQTLMALKKEIQMEYSEVNANWDAIDFAIKKEYLNREAKSCHVKFSNRIVDRYQWG